MGRAPCCEKNGLKKGPWTPEEDQKLIDHIQKHGYGNWRTLPKNAGLQRCGKSCRLRWTNYLRPDIKRGRFSFEEEETIIQLHSILGNKWSAIASRLPGRTDNEIKNYWNTHIRRRLLRMGIDPVTHSPRLDLLDLSSIVTSSLYGSSLMNVSRLLGMQQPLVNPELLKLASSLISSQQRESLNFCSQENQLRSLQIQNQIPHFVQIEHEQVPATAACTTLSAAPCDSLPLTEAPLVQPNVDPNYYPSNLADFVTQQHSQLSDWQTEDYVPQLPNYHYYNQNLMDPPKSETSATFYSNNSTQNFSFASVLSTPSSSPTYINGSSTEDERDSYGSGNMLNFEIPDILDVSEFM